MVFAITNSQNLFLSPITVVTFRVVVTFGVVTLRVIIFKVVTFSVIITFRVVVTFGVITFKVSCSHNHSKLRLHTYSLPITSKHHLTPGEKFEPDNFKGDNNYKGDNNSKGDDNAEGQ
jgi:hypothetical protein